jgi:glycosyltransferase involved in cell wall biosynthesis
MATLENRQIGPILIVDLSRIFTGTEVRVFALAQAMHDRIPYAVAVLNGSALHKKMVEAKLTTLPLPFTKADPRLLLGLLRAIRQHGFTVVDAHNAQSQFWGLLAARVTRVPLRVSTLHASYRALYGGPKGWLYEKVLKLNGKWNCHFIAVSGSAYEYLERIGIERNHISLIYNGIRLSEWSSPTPRSSLRESFGWGPETFVITTVASLRPVKGHRYLLDALGGVIQDRPNIRCLFVGEGWLRKTLESQVRELGLEKHVRFAGFQKDVKGLLHISDAFCLPSLSEALPFALLEASACRLPLLVTGVGDIPNLFRNRETALIVPPADSGALAEGLKYLIDNPEQGALMAGNAYELIQDTLSPEKMLEKTLEVYEGKLNRKDP